MDRLLQTLDVSHNAISSLPLGLWTVVSLRSLLLGHNRLSSIKEEIVQLSGLQVTRDTVWLSDGRGYT